MTAFLDPRRHDALLVLGAVHGLTLEQLTYGLQLLDADAAALVADLLRARLAQMQPASKRQRERYGADAQAICLSAGGRQLWRQLVDAEQAERERSWRERKVA